MTTEKETFEAQEILKEFRKGLDSLSEYKLIGALDMAIEVLNHSEIPNGSGKDTNVPSKDTIYRQDAIDAVTSSVMEWDEIYAQDLNVRISEAIQQLPSAQPERPKDIIQNFHDYQVEWLKSHCDIELEPELEMLIVRFLNDTANCYIMEIERQTG